MRASRLVSFIGMSAVAFGAAGCAHQNSAPLHNGWIPKRVVKKKTVEPLSAVTKPSGAKVLAWRKATYLDFSFDVPKSLVQSIPYSNILMDKKRWMTLGYKVSSLQGQKGFCARHKDQCGFKNFLPELIVYSDELQSMLEKLTTKTNQFFKPKTDKENYGVEELWNLPAVYADCDDYAAVKRKVLLDAGFPASALLLTHVNDSSGGSHLVLAVRTTEGDFMLDNLNNNVKRWNQMGYQAVHSVVNPRDSESWLRVGAGNNFRLFSTFRF